MNEHISEVDIERRLTPTSVPPSVKIKDASVDENYLHVFLNDGRILATPLSFYPTLRKASEEQRAAFRVIGAGYGLEWETLDFHLSLEGMLAGRPERGAKKSDLTVSSSF